MILLQLFWSFFQIGLFSIGGGYAAIPLIEQQAVNTYGWITQSEFLDLIIIAEMTPGPITINSATFVGIQAAGMPGAIVATIGCILPAGVVVSFLAWLYFKYSEQKAIQGVLDGLRPAVIALIATAGIKIVFLVMFGEVGITGGLSALNLFAIILFAALLVVIQKFKITPIIIMLMGGVVGFIYYLITGTSI